MLVLQGSTPHLQLGITPAVKHLQALLCSFAAGPSPTVACLDSSPVAQPRCCWHTVLKMALLCAGPRPALEAPEAEPSHARAHRQLHRVRLLREQLPQQGRHADAPPAHHHPARAGPPEGHALPHSWPASQVCSPVPAADLLGHGLPSGACGTSLLPRPLSAWPTPVALSPVSLHQHHICAWLTPLLLPFISLCPSTLPAAATSRALSTGLTSNAGVLT